MLCELRWNHDSMFAPDMCEIQLTSNELKEATYITFEINMTSVFFHILKVYIIFYQNRDLFPSFFGERKKVLNIYSQIVRKFGKSTLIQKYCKISFCDNLIFMSFLKGFAHVWLYVYMHILYSILYFYKIYSVKWTQRW